MTKTIKRSLLVVAPVAIALVIAACGGGSKSATTTTSTTSAAAASAPAKSAGATVGAKSSSLGTFLVDAKGRALYLFEADKGSSSTCYSACASVWPPLTTTGTPKAGGAVSAAKLGTTTRKDGKTEVTYNGHPLYYYAGDSQPGATNGQGLDQFGAEWYVVGPKGSKLEDHGS